MAESLVLKKPCVFRRVDAVIDFCVVYEAFDMLDAFLDLYRDFRASFWRLLFGIKNGGVKRQDPRLARKHEMAESLVPKKQCVFTDNVNRMHF